MSSHHDFLLKDSPDVSSTRPGWLTRFFGKAFSGIGRRAVLSIFEDLAVGLLVLEEKEKVSRFGVESDGNLLGHISVHDERFWTEVFSSGTVGAGEAYRQGWWSSDDLTNLIRLLVRNRNVMQSMERGFALLSSPLRKLAHWTNRNTLSGSRENISAHYDLSNDFFASFLDSTMSYSCGIYKDKDSTLEEASIEKIDLICRKLELNAGDTLLEIGTGWGALALHAASEYGAKVTTTTLSKEQAEWASKKFHERGCEDSINLLLKDYRELRGDFDKLVSVEMVEAIGWKNFDSYFQTINDCLSPDGLALVQAITISDQYYEEARRSVDFIQKYIFPGSCIPSISALLEASCRSSDLKMIELEDITQHYVPTLAAWRENMRLNSGKLRDMGFDDKFLRTWDYYFSYCEGGFSEHHIGDVQMMFAKPSRIAHRDYF